MRADVQGVSQVGFKGDNDRCVSEDQRRPPIYSSFLPSTAVFQVSDDIAVVENGPLRSQFFVLTQCLKAGKAVCTQHGTMMEAE